MEEKSVGFVLIGMAFILSGTNAQNQPDRNIYFTQCPSDTTVKSGQSVTLACALDHPVNCSWMRNATPVTISSRYRYADGHDGRNTSNCTVEITGANHTLDAGNWTCTVKTDNGKVSPGSRSARLSVQLANDPPGSTAKNLAKLDRSPVSANVTAGKSVILACEFDRPVNCSWKRNTSIVTISDRYKYIDDGNGIKTRKCSIKIEMAKNQDAGNWTCVTTATSAEEGMQSQPAYLHVAEIYTEKFPSNDNDGPSQVASGNSVQDPEHNSQDQNFLGFGYRKMMWVYVACGLFLSLTLLNTIGLSVTYCRLRTMAKHFLQPSTEIPIYEEITKSVQNEPEQIKSQIKNVDDDQQDVTINVLYEFISPII